MKALRKHLEKMHSEKKIVKSFNLSLDCVLTIKFSEVSKIYSYPCSLLEKNLDVKLEELKRAGFVCVFQTFMLNRIETVVHFINTIIPYAQIDNSLEPIISKLWSDSYLDPGIINQRKDCKDSYVMNLKCETCGGLGTIDERIGGIATSNPEATCPDCGGEDYVLHHPEGTPGPCMTCANTTCPDCKDGYYYPLIGPRESCRSCS